MLPPYVHFSYPNLLSTFANPPIRPFLKPAHLKQNDGDYSPFVDKQYNSYINDINNGIYTNSSLTLVNFDLGQIYNSAKHTNPSDMFIVIPVTMAAAFSNSGTIVAPVPGSSALCSLKSNFLNLIHQADISVQGKTLESTQAYINICKHFQMISEMSENEISTAISRAQ